MTQIVWIGYRQSLTVRGRSTSASSTRWQTTSRPVVSIAGRRFRPTERWRARWGSTSRRSRGLTPKEAGRQGLTEARVGRGTFVKGVAPPAARPLASPGIDLSMNLPPQPANARFDSRLAHTLGEIRAGAGFAAYFALSAAGRHGERAPDRGRLDGPSTCTNVPADRVLLAPGTQPALYALLAVHTQPGDTLLTECLTYPGIKAAAAAAGVTVVGLAMDAEGVIPSALDRAARAHAAKLVYLMPTIHNPTTITMPEERRRRVADVIRKRGLMLIEDDPYSFLAPGFVCRVRHWSRTRSYLAGSLAKCIAPGFRASIARLHPTSKAAEQRGEAAARHAANVGAFDGKRADTVDARRNGDRHRRCRARRSNCATNPRAENPGRGVLRSPPAGAARVGAQLPDGLPAARFAAELHGRGLAVVTADAFSIDAEPPGAIRLALGAAQSRAQLVKALEILSGALTSRSLTQP